MNRVYEWKDKRNGYEMFTLTIQNYIKIGKYVWSLTVPHFLVFKSGPNKPHFSILCNFCTNWEIRLKD